MGTVNTKRIGVMMELNRPFKRYVSVYEGILEYVRKHPDWRITLEEWIDHSLPGTRHHRFAGMSAFDAVARPDIGASADSDELIHLG